ncbi:TlpA family protein disulfide reductase [Lysobacter sp. CA196]|uniref:TlpA family protein disulfide reductase n=1 Tax=Lysobacter sp. CA196 TaxID=3455606 RepID=UPI003F8D63E4
MTLYSSRQWARTSIAACVLLAMCWSGGVRPVQAETGKDYAQQIGARLVGQAVPAFVLTTIDGQRLDLGALRGRKAVYLKFWATWCVPCREQMPHFEKAQRSAGDDLQVVAINIGFDDTVEQIKAYRRELGLSMPIVRDDDGALGERFGLRVTPQHVVIGKDGTIRYVGHLADARLDAALAEARRMPGFDPGVLVAAAPSASTAQNVLQIGEPVPTSKIRTLEARKLALTDPVGQRPSVLAFLSPWCESYLEKTRPQSSKQCRVLREQLVSLGRDHRVRWVGIASGLWASEQDLRDYRNAHRVPVPLSLDRDGVLFRRFGIQRVPSLLVVGADGRLLRRIEVDDAMPSRLQSLLGGAGAMTRGDAAGVR